MFKFDVFNSPEPFKFYLCKPNDELVCELNAIDGESADISLNMNNQFELSFDYKRYISTDDGNLIESNGYHNLTVGMNILVDQIGLFKLKYPPMKYDGNCEIKSVTAYSIECELEAKDLVKFKINTGEDDSLEYLVTYEDGETEKLINDYSGLPYDYIVFYNTFPEQLSKLLNKYNNNSTYTSASAISEIVSYCKLIPRLKNKVNTASDGTTSVVEYVEYTYDTARENVKSIYLSNEFNSRISELINFYTKYRDQLSLISLAIEKSSCNWSIGSIDESLCNKKFQFDVDGVNIYSFLTTDVASVAKCVFDFDIINRKINSVLAENIGKHSSVTIDKKNFINTIDISCNDEELFTRYNVSGGNDIGIQYVNFGTSRIDNISWFLNARDENGNRIYVSDDLANKYAIFEEDRKAAREQYIQYTKEYNQAITDIDTIKYRAPNDSVQNDWDTFTDAELENSLTVYNNLLVTCISLYKDDYGNDGCNADGSVNENYMKNTEYWYDYYAYKITIEQIEATIAARINNSSYKEIDDDSVLSVINAWKTEWTLYGTVELQNKITAYNNSMNVLVDGEAIILKTDSDEAKKWNELTDGEKTEYGSIESNYQYDTYMQLYNERNSCQEYLDTLMAQLTELETKRDTAQDNRTAIVMLMDISKYDRAELAKIVTLDNSSTSMTFTESEVKTINLLYIDKNYINENILTTSLDTSVTEIDIQRELLEDAEEELSIESQPQIVFQTEIDNLLAMPEFKNFDFYIGNYVTVEYYDDYYVDLRLYSLSFNPCIPESNPIVSFTNFIKSKSKRSDVSYILNQATGGSSSSSSKGSSGSSGTFGDSDDIDVTISNTMLAKLLNTEMFGTRVSNVILDTIQVNKIVSKYAKFDGLAKGSTTIDGQCIKTGVIISNNYNGTASTDSNGAQIFELDNTQGSIMNVLNGQFNFGGGGIKWDGSILSVTGEINAESGIIGGWKIGTNAIYNNIEFTNTKIGNSTGIGTYGEDWAFWAGNGKFSVKQDGTLVAIDASISGDITATTLNAIESGQIGCWLFDSNSMWDEKITAGVNKNGAGQAFWAGGSSKTGASAPFRVDHSGNLYSSNANITGTITTSNLTATGGTIGGFTISTNKLYATGTSNYTIVMQKWVSGENKWVFAAGGTSHESYLDCPFRVRYDGRLYAKDVRVGNVLAMLNGSWDDQDASYHTIMSYSNSILKVGYSSSSLVLFGSSIDLQATSVYVTGSLKVSKNVQVEGTTTLIGNVRVDGAATFNGNATVKGILTAVDYSGNARRPVSSALTDGRRASYLSTHLRSSDTTYFLKVEGQYGTTGETYKDYNYLSTSSDVRLKSNITPTDVEALPIVNSINVRQFDWIETGSHQKIGFVADELELLDSAFAVGGGYNENGNMDVKCVNTFYLLGYAVKAIQEMSEQIDILKEEIKTLKQNN